MRPVFVRAARTLSAAIWGMRGHAMAASSQSRQRNGLRSVCTHAISSSKRRDKRSLRFMKLETTGFIDQKDTWTVIIFSARVYLKLSAKIFCLYSGVIFKLKNKGGKPHLFPIKATEKSAQLKDGVHLNIHMRTSTVRQLFANAMINIKVELFISGQVVAYHRTQMTRRQTR